MGTHLFGSPCTLYLHTNLEVRKGFHRRIAFGNILQDLCLIVSRGGYGWEN